LTFSRTATVSSSRLVNTAQIFMVYSSVGT
jgi:hypothetical protein